MDRIYRNAKEQEMTVQTGIVQRMIYSAFTFGRRSGLALCRVPARVAGLSPGRECCLFVFHPVSINFSLLTYNLGQNPLGKCDAPIVCVIKIQFFLLSPLPPFQCWFKQRPKACTVFCITLSALVWEGWGGGRTNIFCQWVPNDA